MILRRCHHSSRLPNLVWFGLNFLCEVSQFIHFAVKKSRYVDAALSIVFQHDPKKRNAVPHRSHPKNKKKKKRKRPEKSGPPANSICFHGCFLECIHQRTVSQPATRSIIYSTCETSRIQPRPSPPSLGEIQRGLHLFFAEHPRSEREITKHQPRKE